MDQKQVKIRQHVVKSCHMGLFISFIKNTEFEQETIALFNTSGYFDDDNIFNKLCNYAKVKNNEKNRKKYYMYWKKNKDKICAHFVIPHSSQDDSFKTESNILPFAVLPVECILQEDVTLSEPISSTSTKFQEKVDSEPVSDNLVSEPLEINYLPMRGTKESIFAKPDDIPPENCVNKDSCVLVIPALFWTYFYRRKKTLHPYVYIENERIYWTDVINSYFKLSYPNCVLTFKWNKCNLGDHASITFRCIAQCKFSGCGKFTFYTGDKIDGRMDVKLTVKVDGRIEHRNEQHRRLIKGILRSQLAKELLIKTPSAVYNEQMKNASSSLRSGNLNDIPNLSILQRISSENIKSTDKLKRLQND